MVAPTENTVNNEEPAINPAPGTGMNYDPNAEPAPAATPAEPATPTVSAITPPSPEEEAPNQEADTAPSSDETPKQADPNELLKQKQAENEELRKQLAVANTANASRDPNTVDVGAPIVDADVEGGKSEAPELPEYPKGATKTFTLDHEMVNSTKDGLKRYKPDVPYTLDAHTADDLMRRDKEYADYQRNIHVRQVMVQPIGTISGNG